MTGIIVDQTGCRINGQGSSTDNKHIRLLDIVDGFVQSMGIQSFFVQNHIWFDRAATFALWHTFRYQIFQRIKFSTTSTVISENTSVKFQYFFTSCFLMQSINILRDDSL